MNFKDFMERNGFRDLSLAKLKPVSFCILLHLFQEEMLGINEVVISQKEFSILLGWSEKCLLEGLEELEQCHMLYLWKSPSKIIRIKTQLNSTLWDLGQIQTKSFSDSGEATNLHTLSSSSPLKKKYEELESPPEDPIPFPHSKDPVTECSADDQVLASSQIPINEIGAFREKYEGIDAKIKALTLAERELIRQEKRQVTADEEILLDILSKHPHPKKQFLLALYSSVAYPNLTHFIQALKVCAKISNPQKK